MKFTFLCLDIHGTVQEAAEDRSDVSDMLHLVMRENQDIIQVNEDKLAQHIPEQVIDQGLEDRWGVCQTKGHHQIFMMSSWCYEGRLPLLSLPDANQMICIPQVELGEHCCPLEQFKGSGKKWEGVAVLNCNVIKTAIVYTGPQRLVLLIHKKTLHQQVKKKDG